MIVHNLTDKAPPGKKLSPLDLRVFGKLLKPGEYGEFSDTSSLKRISGWVYSGRVSVDVLPGWYKKAKKASSQALRVVPDEEPKLVPQMNSEEPPSPDEPEDEVPVKHKGRKKKGKRK